ncbi:ABC transporter ATP-binding protein [Halodurantibacterium flavum]|uniref:ABC transporter ATP-binding protein n=1 Tax=Halodurantibacterium flavum TaxID=1382802 RepID=A0ABW4S1J6_9RHOB
MAETADYLDIAGLKVGYGSTPVLSGIDLSIARGEFVALLGASGCGKTTLLRSLAGFVTPDAGRISVDGRDITRLPPDRRGMALMFQTYALWPHMTVGQHIAYGLRLRRVARAEISARVAELETMLGLQGLSDRKPAQLSGGQRQRVALGRALAVRPDILLLDEPLSNLDARIRLQLRDEIRALQKQLGITAVHVTHDREEAMVMADRIVIMDRGRIQQVGTPETLYNHPASAFVAAFMGAENSLPLELGPKAGPKAGPEFGSGGFIPHTPRRPGLYEARFRAEAARLHAPDAAPAPGPGTLSLPVTVEAVSYPGGVWLHRLRHDGAILQATAPHPLPVGPAVLQVPPDALFLFPAGDDAPGPSPFGTGNQDGRQPDLLSA